MVILKKILLPVFVLTVTEIGYAASSKPLLTVYYESQCPDSRSFVLRQLRPAMRRLHALVRLRFVPFGKAMSMDYGFGGFECQHGPKECLGNMIQDCTLELMTDRNDWEKLQYVACEMDTYAASNGDFQCVEKSQVSVEKARRCLNLGRGTTLQLHSEYLTSLVPHTKKFVPTITINNEFQQEVQDFAMVDLLGTLCSHIAFTKPCSAYYNHRAWRRIMYEPHTFSPNSLSSNYIR